jgi:hypothetical protein
MHKFDTVINEFLGSLVKGTASAAGSFLKAAEDPSFLGQTIKNYQTEKGKKEGQSYGVNNQPKPGDIAIYQQNPEVTAHIDTKVATAPYKKENVEFLEGQFQVTLMKPDRKTSPYSFVKTENNPDWRIEKDEIILRNESGPQKKKDFVLTETDPRTQRPVRQQFKTMVVGKSTKFPNWSSYKAYVNSQK